MNEHRWIGNKLVGHMILVVDIANEGLVGTDFLMVHRIIIDFVAKKSHGKAQYFSTLDVASGFWQIGLTQEARENMHFALQSHFTNLKSCPSG